MVAKNEKMTCKLAMQLIGGISQATASRYIHQVKQYLNKQQQQIVTAEEFCIYYGIKLE